MEFLGSGVDGRNRSAGSFGQVSRLSSIGLALQPLLHQRDKLAKGIGITKTARLTGLGTGTVHRLKRETDRGLPHQEHGGAMSVGPSITVSLQRSKRVGRVPIAE